MLAERNLDVLYPAPQTIKMFSSWKWYNKVDTKLREFNERWCFMKRKSYDKQFKIAAVKLILEEEVPVSVFLIVKESPETTLIPNSSFKFPAICLCHSF